MSCPSTELPLLPPAKDSGSEFVGDFRTEESNMSQQSIATFVGDFRDENNFTEESHFPTPSGDAIPTTPSPFQPQPFYPTPTGAPVGVSDEKAKDAYKKSGSKQKFADWIKSDQASQLLNTSVELLARWQDRKNAQMYGQNAQMYGDNTGQQPTKSNTWIWITVGIVVVILIIVLGIVISRRSK